MLKGTYKYTGSMGSCVTQPVPPPDETKPNTSFNTLIKAQADGGSISNKAVD